MHYAPSYDPGKLLSACLQNSQHAAAPLARMEATQLYPVREAHVFTAAPCPSSLPLLQCIVCIASCAAGRKLATSHMHFNLRFFVVGVVQEHWSGVPGNGQNGGARSNGGGWFGGRPAAEEHRIEPRSPLPTQPHDIAFCACEGDFQVRGRSGVFPADQIPLPCLKQHFY